jgi:AraC-like DNA-binding protein
VRRKIEHYHLHKAHPEKLQFQIYHLEDYLVASGEHAQVPHSHSFYQILWIYNEGGQHFVDFDGYKALANTVFFISKNQIHYFDKAAKHKGLIIHFNEQFLMQSDVDIFLKYNVFNNLRKPCYSISEETQNLANSYIKLITEELTKDSDFGHKQVIRYLLKSLLIIFEREHRKENLLAVQFSNSYELQFLQFRELLEANFNKNFSVKDYADLLHISTKTLTTITNRLTAKPPSSLIAERVILEAERLLAFTPLKVNEIGYQLGFEDPSYFVKYFKRHVKISPTVYRSLR